MQNIVIDKPYQFVPPKHSNFWPRILKGYLPRYLRKNYGIESHEVLGLEHFQASLAAGHGILLAPNHCRPCDPMVVTLALAKISQPAYLMASWHLFMQSCFQSWLLPRLGAFSVYREGLDREAIKCAVEVLISGRRPLIIFPEGAVTRTNDRLNHFMEGIALIARNAAKHRAAAIPAGKVVIHPVALRYFFGGDINHAIAGTLEQIERRLSWHPLPQSPLLDRIAKVGNALLTLKELEYFGAPQTGTLAERLAGMIERLLGPLEEEWLNGRREGDVISRVKTLRTAILPEMVEGQISEAERSRRWRQLTDLYLAQQISLYPPDYFDSPPSVEQLLETVERFEEDLTDQARIHRPLRAAIAIGKAIEVTPLRQRGQGVNPLMAELRSQVEKLLAE